MTIILHFILAVGMIVTLKVGNKEDIRPPPANFPTCGNYFMPIDE